MMSNVVDTIEGNTGPTRALSIVWKTKKGDYLYIPSKDDIIKIRLFDNQNKVIFEKECKYINGKIVVYFPSDLESGDYDYEVIIEILNNNQKTIKTVLSSKYHVGRR